MPCGPVCSVCLLAASSSVTSGNPALWWHGRQSCMDTFPTSRPRKGYKRRSLAATSAARMQWRWHDEMLDELARFYYSNRRPHQACASLIRAWCWQLRLQSCRRMSAPRRGHRPPVTAVAREGSGSFCSRPQRRPTRQTWTSKGVVTDGQRALPRAHSRLRTQQLWLHTQWKTKMRDEVKYAHRVDKDKALHT